MESIQLEPTKWAIVIGYIEYHAGREYPWLGRHGCVVAYFATKNEATQFAITGGD